MNILIGGDIRPVTNPITFGPQLKQLVTGADEFIVNLECAIRGDVTPPKIGIRIECNESFVGHIASLGVSVVTLANNHIGDFGSTGIQNTISACEKNELKHVGAGNRTENFNSLVLEDGDLKIGILNFAEKEFGSSFRDSSVGYASFDYIDFHYSLAKLKASCDKIVLIYHGGIEYVQVPMVFIKKLFRYFIDAGVDVVISHHTHFYSGYEYYRNGFIAYGLGNFASEANAKIHGEKFHHGLIVMLNIAKDNLTATVHHIRLKRETSDIELYVPGEQEQHALNSINEIIADDNRLMAFWNQYLDSKKVMLKYWSLLSPVPEMGIKIMRKLKILNPKYSRRNLLGLLNVLRNDSHRNLFVSQLENEFEQLKN